MSLRPLFLACLLASAAAPVLAADPLPSRVDKLEKEMKAVQRKVFPGGSPAFFEPEIAPQPAAPAPAAGPSVQPLNELYSRVDSLERELSRLTAKIEEDEHRLDVMSQAAAKDRADLDARLKVLEGAGQPAPGAAQQPVPLLDVPPPPPTKRGGKTPPPADKAPPPVAAPVVDPATPSSGDPGEDAYMAGYKLWEQKKFPEAQAALEAMIKKYPKHKRASYARNLLGRAQLDGGTPAMAAQTLYANYQTDPRGERAPDSLFYLGQALTDLKKSADACKAYGELEDVYGSTLSAGLKAKLPAAKKAASCK